MSARSNPSETAKLPRLMHMERTVPRASAAAVRAAHGALATWNVVDFEVYRDLERSGAPAAAATGGDAA